MIDCSKWDKILALGPLLFPFEWWSRNSRVFPTVKQDKDPSDLQRYFPFSQNMSKMLKNYRYEFIQMTQTNRVEWYSSYLQSEKGIIDI